VTSLLIHGKNATVTVAFLHAPGISIGIDAYSGRCLSIPGRVFICFSQVVALSKPTAVKKTGFVKFDSSQIF